MTNFAEAMMVAELEEYNRLFDEKVAGTDIPRWGSFDRLIVGDLLEEVNRLQRLLKSHGIQDPRHKQESTCY